MKCLKKNLLGNKGQAAVEFIAVIVVIFFFLFFYLTLAFTLVVSDYMEYATFMAARTYKSGYSTREYQEKYAREIFNIYAERAAWAIENPRLDFYPIDPQNQQRAGVVSSYDVNLYYLPPLFALQGFPGSAMTLQSEVRLGRDPAYEDCQNFFTKFSRSHSLGVEGSGLLLNMFDNGC